MLTQKQKEKLFGDYLLEETRINDIVKSELFWSLRDIVANETVQSHILSAIPEEDKNNIAETLYELTSEYKEKEACFVNGIIDEAEFQRTPPTEKILKKARLDDIADKLINYCIYNDLTLGWLIENVNDNYYKKSIVNNSIMIDLYSGDNSILLYDGSEELIRYIETELM